MRERVSLAGSLPRCPTRAPGSWLSPAALLGSLVKIRMGSEQMGLASATPYKMPMLVVQAVS